MRLMYSRMVSLFLDSLYVLNSELFGVSKDVLLLCTDTPISLKGHKLTIPTYELLLKIPHNEISSVNSISCKSEK